MDRLNLDKLKVFAAATTLAMFAGVACAESHMKVEGQLNRLLTHYDVGTNGTLFSDNAFSPSSLAVMGHADIDRCYSVGGVIEGQYAPDNSLMVSQMNQTNTLTKLVFVSKADAHMKTPFGKVSLGNGDAASFGVMTTSYSKAGSTISSASVRNLAGGLLFKPTSRALATTDPSVSSAFSDLDGIHANDLSGYYDQVSRIRYDSPKFYGLWFSASTGKVPEYVTVDGDITDADTNRRHYTDFAVKFEQCMDDFMVGASFGWARKSLSFANADDRAATPTGTSGLRSERLWAASVAVEHKPMGINAAFGYGNKRFRIPTANDNKNWFVQVGKHFCWTDWGKSHVVADYFKGKNTRGNGDDSKSYQVGIVQDIDKANASVYATYRQYKYDPKTFSTLRYDDVNVFALGFMYKFGAMI